MGVYVLNIFPATQTPSFQHWRERTELTLTSSWPHPFYS